VFVTNGYGENSTLWSGDEATPKKFEDAYETCINCEQIGWFRFKTFHVSMVDNALDHKRGVVWKQKVCV
jgi:catabolite regulation protein CreA